MFSAYLEDFRDIKIIINSDITLDKNNLYALYNNKEVKLFVINEENFENSRHIYLRSEEDIEPMYDTFIKNGEFKSRLLLGKITIINDHKIP